MAFHALQRNSDSYIKKLNYRNKHSQTNSSTYNGTKQLLPLSFNDTVLSVNAVDRKLTGLILSLLPVPNQCSKAQAVIMSFSLFSFLILLKRQII